MATVSELSENERTILKSLLKLKRDETGILTFSASEIGKELGLNQEEVESIIDRLVSKGYFTLLKAPRTSVPIRHAIDELNELDYEYLVAYVNPEQYVTRRNRLIRKLSEYGIEEAFVRSLSMSPKLAVEAYQQLRGYLDKLEKMSQLQDIHQDTPAVRILLEEYSKGIVEARKLLDLFRARVSEYSRDLDSRTERTKISLQELQLRFKLGEIGEDEFKGKEIALNDRLEELHVARFVLANIMMGEKPLPEPPLGLVEQLELIEARRVIGELDEKNHNELKSRTMREIKNSRRPRGDVTEALLGADPSSALVKRLNKLEKAKLLPATICIGLRKAANSDLSAVRAILSESHDRRRSA